MFTIILIFKQKVTNPVILSHPYIERSTSRFYKIYNFLSHQSYVNEYGKDNTNNIHTHIF